MKRIHYLFAVVPALAAFLLLSSAVGAETSLEIRLTLVPAVSARSASPQWAPCAAYTQTSLVSPALHGRVGRRSPAYVRVVGRTVPVSGDNVFEASSAFDSGNVVDFKEWHYNLEVSHDSG